MWDEQVSTVDDVVAVSRVGADLAVTVHLPRRRRIAGAVVVWPAMGVAARHYRVLAAALARSGVPVVVVDLPGQGRSAPRPSRNPGIGYQGLAASCVPAVTGWVRAELVVEDVHHLGHSLGGQAALLAAARGADSARSVILVACGTPHRAAFPPARRVGITVGVWTMRAVTRVVGYWPGHRMGFGGKQSRRLVGDWARAVLSGRFVPEDADIDYERALGDVTLPILAVTVAGDRLAPGRATEQLCAKAPLAEVRWREFAAAEPVDHISWLRHAADLAPLIVEWLLDPRFTR